MTPNEMNILRCLIAVAWADGKMATPEEGILDGLFWAFDADEAEESELKEYASKKRTFDEDAPIGELSRADKELLLANAALMTHADGKQTGAEKKLLDTLIAKCGFSEDEAKPILAEAKVRAAKLAEKI